MGRQPRRGAPFWLDGGALSAESAARAGCDVRLEQLSKLLQGAGLSAVLLSASWASAQEVEVIQQPDRTEYKKKTVIDFNDVMIQGELTKPEGSYLLNRKKTKFRSLLKIRANFLPELFNSTDNL